MERRPVIYGNAVHV